MEPPAFERLGDIEGIAAVNWALALVDLARGDGGSPLPQAIESFAIFNRLQRADVAAIVGTTLGRLLATAGVISEARQVLGMARRPLQRSE